MKPLNVFIFPTDDRSGQASVIYHYAKLGHNVFLPKHGTMGLNWKITATWPALLYKSSEDPTKRNLEIHGFERSEETLFGEDFFVTEFNAALYEEPYTCSIVDPDNCPEMDLIHTLRGGENFLPHYFSETAKRWPRAKWVSSTFNTWTASPSGFTPQNAAKLIPANYETAHSDRNNVSLMCHEFEATLLGLENEHNFPVVPFASFNHNFHIRQPQDFVLFTQMNEQLSRAGRPVVPNFGGNIRAQGADIRYSGVKGKTGSWQTLSPRQAMRVMRTIHAVVHFKQTDWGGGVFYHALNSNTPIITTQRYVDASNSGKYLVHNHNCFIVNSPDEACAAVLLLEQNSTQKALRSGMEEMKNSVFSPDYWTRWEKFLENLV